MGADLILAHTRAPHYAEGINDLPIPEGGWWNYALEVARQRIRDFDFASWGEGDLESLLLDFGIESGDDRIVQLRRELITQLENFWPGGGRDVATLTIEGNEYWFTGGMSWGDTPTDSYEIVNALGWLGIFDEPIPAPAVGPTDG